MATLSEIRQAKGITQIELADAAGLTQKQISIIENGKVLPRNETRQKIETVLNEKVDWVETRCQSNLTTHTLTDMTDEFESVIETIAIYLQSGQFNERKERFELLKKFIKEYAKKLKIK